MLSTYICEPTNVSLKMSALFTGSNLIELPSVDSTNNYAQSLLRQENIFEGTVVWARQQTQGRGQRGKQWESASDKNLTFSIIYYPVFLSAAWQFRLSMAVALGVLDSLKALFHKNGREVDNLKIKWPNDIYYKDKKIAGILIENSVSQGNLSTSIIGIGLNVNQTDFSPELPNPSSLKLVLGQSFEIKVVLMSLCEFIEAGYLKLKANHETEIQQDYLNNLYRLDVSSGFLVGEREIKAAIKGIEPSGKLVLKKSDGEIQSYGLNEISMII